MIDDKTFELTNFLNFRNSYISLEDILEIHKRVLGHVDPIEGGMFRRTQVYVGNHVPPKPQEVHILMDTFVQWMNSKEASELHPIKLAAIVHYKLVHIHPFTDGNGRTSRLLMNTILMKFGFPPVVIQKQQRFETIKIPISIRNRLTFNFVLDINTTTIFKWQTRATFDRSFVSSQRRPRRL